MLISLKVIDLIKITVLNYVKKVIITEDLGILNILGYYISSLI